MLKYTKKQEKHTRKLGQQKQTASGLNSGLIWAQKTMNFDEKSEGYICSFDRLHLLVLEKIPFGYICLMDYVYVIVKNIHIRYAEGTLINLKR